MRETGQGVVFSPGEEFTIDVGDTLIITPVNDPVQEQAMRVDLLRHYVPGSEWIVAVSYNCEVLVIVND